MREEWQLKHKESTEQLVGIYFEGYNELGHGNRQSGYWNRLLNPYLIRGKIRVHPGELLLLPLGNLESN